MSRIKPVQVLINDYVNHADVNTLTRHSKGETIDETSTITH